MYQNPMDEFKDKMAEIVFGMPFSEAQKKKVCVSCGNRLANFRDAISIKESQISGLCQSCQDEVFGGD